MNGQWIGEYSGSNNGIIVVDIDDIGDRYQGYAHVFDGSAGLPDSFIMLDAPKDNTFSLFLDVFPLDPLSRKPTKWEHIKDSYQDGIDFPESAEVNFSVKEGSLTIAWKTNIGTHGTANPPQSKAGEPSEYTPDPSIETWEDFKKHVNDLEPRRFIFRGQNGPWRLRTSFHRKGRADLVRFSTHDIPALHRNLSARTKHIFNLTIPDENGAFFNLVQHHGYPTPLLDWTYSPYVAAFFACLWEYSDNEKVRILVFDQKQWRQDFPQLESLAHTKPHFSLIEFLAINNERMIPQQAVSSVTNLDDIESYIQSKEKESKHTYLKVIELPSSERRKIMQELSVMGITAGSLFPGLDGACEELKERFFT